MIHRLLLLRDSVILNHRSCVVGVVSEFQEQHFNGMNGKGDEMHQCICHDSEVDAKQRTLGVESGCSENTLQSKEAEYDQGGTEGNNGAFVIRQRPRDLYDDHNAHDRQEDRRCRLDLLIRHFKDSAEE